MLVLSYNDESWIALDELESICAPRGAVDRLDFTAIGPAVNLVSRLEGLCKPLGRSGILLGGP